MLRYTAIRRFANVAGPEIGVPKRELSRHVTADGGNSLKKHLVGGREKSAIRLWWNQMGAATYPLFASIAAGVFLAGWYSYRQLNNPELKISKMNRKSTIRENHEEGKQWVSHRASMRALPGNVVPEKEIIKREGSA